MADVPNGMSLASSQENKNKKLKPHIFRLAINIIISRTRVQMKSLIKFERSALEIISVCKRNVW
jgi:hypothetical protein